jgi:hypothetical protein
MSPQYGDRLNGVQASAIVSASINDDATRTTVRLSQRHLVRNTIGPEFDIHRWTGYSP